MQKRYLVCLILHSRTRMGRCHGKETKPRALQSNTGRPEPLKRSLAESVRWRNIAKLYLPNYIFRSWNDWKPCSRFVFPHSHSLWPSLMPTHHAHVCLNVHLSQLRKSILPLAFCGPVPYILLKYVNMRPWRRLKVMRGSGSEQCYAFPFRLG